MERKIIGTFNIATNDGIKERQCFAKFLHKGVVIVIHESMSILVGEEYSASEYYTGYGFPIPPESSIKKMKLQAKIKIDKSKNPTIVIENLPKINP